MKPAQPFSRPRATFTVLLLAALLCGPYQPAHAALVTAKQAVVAVTGWLNLDHAPLGEPLGTSVLRVETFSDSAGNALYYVVYLAPSGFVIVAADNLVEPIICFAPAGTFDPSTSNPLGALVSKDLANRVDSARAAGTSLADTAAAQAQAKWQQLTASQNGSESGISGITSVSSMRVAPLTQTTWSQQRAADGSTALYNYYTPPYASGTSTNYPSGCVATAMAQLMRYYRFPSTGVGPLEFTIYSNGSPLTYYLLGGNGSGGPYLWDNMPVVPPSTPSLAQRQAIGALIADAAASVQMSYTATNSSASPRNAKNALLSTFKYANAVYGANGNANIGAGLTNMLNPNLDARCPVLLSIQRTDGGHAVIADGYGYNGPTNAPTLYHHLNLGWAGTATAWYALPVIDTGYGTYNVVDASVYNVFTNGNGEIISGRVLDQIGRPVTNATVTTTRSGSTYTAITDTNGIYALAGLPSSSTYSITVSRTNFNSATNSFPTGVSSDFAATSGNYWGANFTLNMLPTVLDHLAWGAVAPTQPLNSPFPVTLTARNLTNGLATGFTGPVVLSAAATGGSPARTIVGNLGDYQTDVDYSHNWTFGYSFTPNTTIQVVAVRTYSGSKVSIWTDTGTRLAEQAVTSPAGTWTETPLTTPIVLSAGTPYRVSVYWPVGTTNYFTYWAGEWPTTFTDGTVGQDLYYVSTDGFPNSIAGTGLGPFLDLRYTVPFSNSIAISPASSGAFVGGVWNGTITVGQVATNIVLKADDGAGHIALSSPFNTVAAIRLLSPQRLANGKFQCTVSSLAGLRLEMQGSTNPANPASWGVVSNLTNTSGTILFTDPATSLQRRFYRARQLP